MPNRAAPHTALKSSIVDYLHLMGAHVYGNLGGLGQTVGRADLTACLQGRYVDIEVKTGGAVQTEKQRTQMRRVRQAGGLYVVAHSLNDVETALVGAGLALRGLLT